MKIRKAIQSIVTMGYGWCDCGSVWLSGMTTYRPHKAVYQARNMAELRMLDTLSPLRLRALVLSSACLSWSDSCQEPLTHFYNAVHFPEHPYTMNYMFLTFKWRWRLLHEPVLLSSICTPVTPCTVIIAGWLLRVFGSAVILMACFGHWKFSSGQTCDKWC